METVFFRAVTFCFRPTSGFHTQTSITHRRQGVCYHLRTRDLGQLSATGIHGQKGHSVGFRPSRYHFERRYCVVILGSVIGLYLHLGIFGRLRTPALHLSICRPKVTWPAIPPIVTGKHGKRTCLPLPYAAHRYFPGLYQFLNHPSSQLQTKMATVPLWTLRIPCKLSLRTFRSARSPGTTPRTIKRPPLLPNSALPRLLSTTTMPAPTMHHRKVSPFTPTSPYMNDIHMADSYPQAYDPDSMLFDFDDATFGEPPSSTFSDIWGDVAIQPKLQPPFQYEHPQAYADQYFDPHFNESPSYNNELYLSNWVHDDIANSPTSPIPIPQSQTFSTPSTTSGSLYSPANFAAMQPLPSSASPASFDDMHRRQRVDSMDSISPSEISLATPNWATQLWDVDSPRMHTRAASSRSPVRRHSPMSTGPHRVRDTSPMQMFQSASAPTAPHMARAYSSNRGDIDRDATVRRKRKTSDPVPSGDKDESCE